MATKNKLSVVRDGFMGILAENSASTENQTALAEQTDRMEGAEDRSTDRVNESLVHIHQNRQERVDYYLGEFIRNEGEQLAFPIHSLEQAYNRANYIVGHIAMRDAVLFYGAQEVLEALIHAWWANDVPVAWAPLLSEMMAALGWFYQVNVVVPSYVKVQAPPQLVTAKAAVQEEVK